MVGMFTPEPLPDDVLQQVFLFSCFNACGYHDDVHLRRVCSVNQQWRRAAISYCALWTDLHLIDFENKSTESMRRATKRMQMYLGRSGTVLPISFGFTASTRNPADETPKEWTPVRKALGILIDEHPRWHIVSLNLPSSGMQQLQKVGGPLPYLRYLDVITPVAFVPSSESEQDSGLNGFVDAPNLRVLSYESKSGAIPWHARSLARLPLSQLEYIESVSYNDRGLYRDILESAALNIEQIVITSHLNDAIPPDLTSTYNLPHLTYLKLYADEFKWDIATHLKNITLPSLRHLEVRCGIPYPTSQMYRGILRLIVNSHCPQLVHLACSSSTDDPQALIEILDLCHRSLRLLDINFPNDVVNLNILTFGRFRYSYERKEVPGLQTLIFRARRNFSITSTQTEALAQMIRTRFAIYVGNYSIPCGERPALREVIFVWSSGSHIRSDIAPKLSGYSYDHSPQEDQAWRDVDSQIRDEFLANDHPRRAFFSTALMQRFDRLLRELESLDLENIDMGTHKLMAHGFPTFLRLLGEKKAGSIPGDNVWGFRRRARQLLDRWKPFLLYDARRFRWCYYLGGILAFRFGTFWGGRRLSEEKLFQEIASKGCD
ncbi:hypothetical protein DFP72DRAFT_1133135 [Ephemerocybe angulata]|uniref:F-box domain-containing protein n=1 Tax=Ephemerocybe angulata TaxID=980116 RepID=A0A8H6HTU6_9AGAR|nr:hypothetical protein DFP72DRAFT_1133135 [Tulosesus angulatus]